MSEYASDGTYYFRTGAILKKFFDETMRQDVNVNGESGYFERSLDAYGREGEPCRRCGAVMRRDKFMNRSSFYCPRCQPRPRG